jgi:hypothetical protein
MIELYLNPDQEGAWEEKESGPSDDGIMDHLSVAVTLLEELRPKVRFAVIIDNTTDSLFDVIHKRYSTL